MLRKRSGWLFLAVLTAAPLSAWAQETLPAPPKRPMPTPEERREKAQRLLGLGGQILQGILQPPAGGAPGEAPPALDIPKLNERFGELVKPLVESDSAIESLKVELDPKQCDVARDRLTLGGEVGLRHTLWSPQPTRLKFSVAFRVEPTPAGPRGVVDLRLTALTDVVAMADFLLAKYKQHPGALAVPTASAAAALYEQRQREKLLATASLTSLDDIADLVTSLAAARLASHNEEIEALRKQLYAESQEDRRQDVAAQLFAARRARDAVLETQLRILRNDHDLAEGIAIVNAPHDGSKPGPERFEALISEDQASVTLTIGFREGIGVYQLSKPLVVDQLRRFQNGDAETLNRTRGLIRGQFERAREQVLGEQKKP